MSDGFNALLVVIFAVHLVAFGVLLVKRRQAYYVALVVTFSLLTAAFALRLFGLAPEVAGVALDRWLRYAAWGAATVSVSWTLLRIRRRIQAGRQN